MARRNANKHVALLAVGSLIVIIGAIIGGIGSFRSVMTDPKEDGPYTVAQAVSVASNDRHYLAVLSHFPEIFDCANVEEVFEETALVVDAEVSIADLEIREAAVQYCWRKSGDQAWLYALFFPLLITLLILGFVAAFRKSGQQAALAGVGFSAAALVYCVVVIAHYQSLSNIPQVLQAFTDCDDFPSAVVNNVETNAIRLAFARAAGTADVNAGDAGVANTGIGAYPAFVDFGGRGNSRYLEANTAVTGGAERLSGVVPKRGWLCEDDWEYDNVFVVTQNLVYGGVAVLAFGLLLVLVAFAYLSHPIVGVVKNPKAANAQKARATEFEGSESYYEYY